MIKFYFFIIIWFALFLVGCTLYVETKNKDRLLLTTERIDNESQEK